MKKSLTLLLAIAMVFSMFATAAFAAEETAPVKDEGTAPAALTTQQKFDALKAEGIFTGFPPNGDAGLNQPMTRAQLAKVLALVLELDPIEGTYSFKDKNYGPKHWAAPFVEAVAKAGIMQGVGKDIFNLTGNVSLQELAKIAVTIFELEPATDAPSSAGVSEWAKGYVKTAVDNKLIVAPANGDFKASALRGVLVEVAYTVWTASQETKVVSAKAVDANNIEVVFSDDTKPFAVKLETALEANKETTVKVAYKGKDYDVKVTWVVNSKALDVAAVNALTSTSVKLDLNTAGTAADVADAVKGITIKDTAGTAVEVKSAILYGEKDVRVTTGATKSKTKYTLTYNSQSFDYVGMDPDTTAPAVIATAIAKTNTTVDVTFNEPVDKTTAETATNYTLDKGLTVSKAVLQAGDTVVRLTVSEQTAGTLYTITVAGVKDLSGNAVGGANTAKFGGVAKDTDGPSVTATAIAKNNIKVQVIFSEEIDVESAETVANYTIDKGLTVTAAKVVTTDEDAVNGTKSVYLTTSSQTAGTLYTVTVAGVKDLSANVVKSSANTAKFGGIAKDTAGPKATATAIANSNSTVTVLFDEELDKATAENVANYAVDKNLTVTKATLQANKTSVKLTTSAQAAGTLYTITVSNVTDVFGNVIDANAKTAKFGGVALDTVGPAVTSAYATLENGVSYVYVTFDKNVDTASAQLGVNYAFDKDLGYGLSATVVTVGAAANRQVKVKTHDQSFNTLYTVTVSNVKSADLVVVKSDANKTSFAGVGADTKPEISFAQAINKRTIVVHFNTTLTQASAVNPANWVVNLNGGADLVTTPAVYNNDAKTVTLYLNADLQEGKLYDVAATLAVVNARGTAQTDVAKLKTQAAGVANSAEFNVDYILAQNNKVIDIFFNDAIDPATIPTPSEVYISGGTAGSDDASLNGVALTALNATIVPISDPKAVRLTLTNATKFVAGKVYTLYIIDAGGNIANVGGVQLKQDATTHKSGEFQFAGSSVAVGAPVIDYIQSIDKRTLKVGFATPVTSFDDVADAAKISLKTTSAATVPGDHYNTARAVLAIQPVSAAADNKEFLVYFAADMTSGNVYELTIDATSAVASIGVPIPAGTNIKGTVAGSNTAHAAPAIASVDVANDGATITIKLNQPAVVAAATGADALFILNGEAVDTSDPNAALPGGALATTESDTITFVLGKALKGSSIVKVGLRAANLLTDRAGVPNVATAAADYVQASVPVDTVAPTAAVLANLLIGTTQVSGNANAVEGTATVKIVADGAGSSAAAAGSGTVTAAANGSFAAITGLTSGIAYDLYVIDAAGNVSAKLDITTN